MTKIHFRPYNPNQTVLFPQRIAEDIAENDPVRMVDALVEGLNLESFRKLYTVPCSSPVSTVRSKISFTCCGEAEVVISQSSG